MTKKAEANISNLVDHWENSLEMWLRLAMMQTATSMTINMKQLRQEKPDGE